MSEATRRIVTGHNADGRSIVLSDGPVPHVRVLPGARFDEVWQIQSPSDPLGLAPAAEPTSPSARITVGSGAGNLIRVIEFAPAGEGGVRSPMHRTRSIDYGIVLEGEIVMILSDSEVVLRPGDVVIQRGTDHAWENRSAAAAKMAFVLTDAPFDPQLSRVLEDPEIMP